MVPRGVQHHFNDTLDAAIHLRKGRDLDAHAPRDRGTDLLSIQLLPFNLARLDNVLRERGQGRFLAQLEAQAFHLAEQATLSMPRITQ